MIEKIITLILTLGVGVGVWAVGREATEIFLAVAIVGICALLISKAVKGKKLYITFAIWGISALAYYYMGGDFEVAIVLAGVFLAIAVVIAKKWKPLLIGIGMVGIILSVGLLVAGGLQWAGADFGDLTISNASDEISGGDVAGGLETLIGRALIGLLLVLIIILVIICL